jgi:hypothetical protein
MLDFPANPTVGQEYFGPTGQVWVWDSVKWVSGAVAGVAFLPITGGTMTGMLTLSGDPALPLQAATKQYADSLGLGGGAFLPLTGGTLSGDLAISPSTGIASLTTGSDTAAAALTMLNAAVGSSRAIRWLSASSLRWILTTINNESGANTGTDLILQGFSDSGLPHVIPLQISRATGLIGVVGDPVDDLGIATKGYVDTAIAGGGIPEAPPDGQTYGREGSTASWLPVVNTTMPINGGSW